MKYGRLGCLLTVLLLCIDIPAAAQNDTLFVYQTGDAVDAYPLCYVTEADTSDIAHGVSLRLENDSLISYPAKEVQRISSQGPALPTLTSFKFNDKFNDQLTQDYEAEVITDTLTFSIAAIGRHLTPSFQLSSPEARAYVNGEEQTSKQSRQFFAHDVTYSTAIPGCRMLRKVLVSEEVWSRPKANGWQPIALTPDRLSTNQPTNFPDSEDLDKLLDNDSATFFQSTWGSGEHTPKDELAHIDIHLPYKMNRFKVRIQTRDMVDYNTTKLAVYTSEDGQQYALLRTLTAKDDDMPTGEGGKVFTSIGLMQKDSFNYVRLEVQEAEHSKVLASGFTLYYLSWAALDILQYFKSSEEPELLQPAVYAYEMVPYGHDYTVRTTWPAYQSGTVPVIAITTDNGAMPNHSQSDKAADKQMWQGASLKLTGNGLCDDMEARITIKGRGNTSWAGIWGKSPYNIKFEEACKPFGLKKGRNWCLIANAHHGSMLCNAVGMKAARLVGAKAANHVIPVELYLNGDYRGSYTFTEKVGTGNNSIDIDESQGVLLELDSYFDETYKFYSSPLSQPINIKAPDLTDEPYAAQATELFQQFRSEFNAFCAAISKNNGYEAMMDVESFATFLLVNDLILNMEIDHPKSTYVYKEVSGDGGTPYVFGPVWDLDCAYGLENASDYCISQQSTPIFSKSGNNWIGAYFFNKVLNSSDVVKKEYYRQWTDFLRDDLDALIDYIGDYYEYAAPSFTHNAYKWGDGSSYAGIVTRYQKWIRTRAQNIYSQLTPYDLDDAVLPLPEDETTRETAPAYVLRGGDDLVIETFAPVVLTLYSGQGIALRTLQVEAGITHIELPAGIYLIGGQKVAVR